MRVIKFDYIYQHEETGMIGHRNMDIQELERGEFALPPLIILVARRQFTGLHDKNGKEIYEGDVVNLDALCPFRAGGTIWKVIPHAVKYEGQSFYPDRLRESKVIGNIYENPELLEEE